MGLFGGKRRYTQKIEKTTNTVIKRLSYEETLQVLQSEGHDINGVINDGVSFSEGGVVREKIGGGFLGKLSNKVSSVFGGGSLGGAVSGGLLGSVTGIPGLGAVTSVLGSLGIGGFGRTKKRVAVDFESSGWNLQKKWLETIWDKAAYRIGIDDIGFFSYSYEQTSERVSIPFTSPLPIRKISLQVDQSIPTAFTDIDATFPWIKYFISVDNGETFIPIAPEEASVLRGDDSDQIKQFININSGIAEEDRDIRESYIDTDVPVLQVRFKYVMTRPTDISDADNYSPILRSYRMKLFPDTTQSALGVDDLRKRVKPIDTRINS